MRSNRRRRAARRAAWLALFIGPAIVLYGVFVVYPLATALWYSLFEWAGTRTLGFVALDNFGHVFTTFPYNEQVGRAFRNNLIFFVGTMAVQNSVGLLLAVLLTRQGRTRRLLQTVYATPFLISPLIIGYIWSLLLSPAFGPVNVVLDAVGLESLQRPWLGDPGLALPVVVIVNAWQWIGGPMLIFSAALVAIPRELEEAAIVDGASRWTLFRRIQWPLLAPATAVVTILTFVGSFNVFDLVFALGGSGGGPAGSMDVLALLFYRTAFQGGSNAIGVSSALAVLMFLFTFGTALVLLWLLRRREERLT